MSTKKKSKIWAAVDNGPGMMVTAEGAYVIGSEKNFIAVDKNGISLMGKGISFGTTGENLRQGGIFVRQNDFISMIPSTIVTPIPPQLPIPPVAMMTGIAKDLPFFIAMMVGAIAGAAIASS